MSGRRTPYMPRTPERALQRFTPQSTDALLREIEECAARGMMVVIRRGQGPAFSIVANEPNFLVRPHPLWGRQPIGTYPDATSALRAGDRWAEGLPPDDEGGDWLGGSAA